MNLNDLQRDLNRKGLPMNSQWLKDMISRWLKMKIECKIYSFSIKIDLNLQIFQSS